MRVRRALGWTVPCVASLLVFVACARPVRDVDPALDVAGGTGAALSIPCPTAGPDRDLDGLTDACELELARGFAPVLRVAAGGCNWDTSVNPPRPGGGYLFVVEPATDSTIRLAYLPAYFRDCGWSGPKCWLPFVDCSPHTGDSEIILLDIVRPHAGVGCRVAGIFLSAHCFGRSDPDCRWYRGSELDRFEWRGGAPVVWVAEGRQANYPSRSACDRGHSWIDTCGRNDVDVRFPIRSGAQNIGSGRRPAGGDGGCLTARDAGSESSLPQPHATECFWRPGARFRGWQPDSAANGATPYARYLADVARFAMRCRRCVARAPAPPARVRATLGVALSCATDARNSAGRSTRQPYGSEGGSMPAYPKLGVLLQSVSSSRTRDLLTEQVVPYLVDIWLADYEAGARDTDIVETTVDTFSYLFDIATGRLIAAWGISRGRHAGARDRNRMRGHPLGAGPLYHRGHAIPHTLGGPTDINLVPQRGAINIGAFRELEKKAVATPGALYFTYWIYDDPLNQTPARVEQGFLVAGRKPEIRTHAN